MKKADGRRIDSLKWRFGNAEDWKLMQGFPRSGLGPDFHIGREPFNLICQMPAPLVGMGYSDLRAAP